MQALRAHPNFSFSHSLSSAWEILLFYEQIVNKSNSNSISFPYSPCLGEDNYLVFQSFQT